MKELKYTSQFKKDLKRIQKNPKRIEGLKKVLQLLREAKTLPKEYKPHLLAGNYSGSVPKGSASILSFSIWDGTGNVHVRMSCMPFWGTEQCEK